MQQQRWYASLRGCIEPAPGQRPVVGQFSSVGTPDGNTNGDRAGFPVIGYDPSGTNTGAPYGGKLWGVFYTPRSVEQSTAECYSGDNDSDGKGSYSCPRYFTITSSRRL